MTKALSITIGQHTSAGRKAVNQDRHGVYVPTEPELTTKGIAVAIADGIGSSEVSQEASSTTVSGFFEDYYATPESWSVITAGQRVLQSLNAWLYGRTRNSEYRYDMNLGYVCTFSAIIFKARQAHLFHSGDTRIYRYVAGKLTQLTTDHLQTNPEQDSYLTRAMGLEPAFRADIKTLDINPGDLFILATDGLYEFVRAQQLTDTIKAHQDDLQKAAETLVEQAYSAGSHDNLTIQLVRIDTVPEPGLQTVQEQSEWLPPPTSLSPEMQFDGYQILRELYISSRSHVFLARDIDSGEQVVLKTLATDLEDDPAAIERFLMEDWIAKRLDNVHCLKAIDSQRQRHYLYTVTEYIEGQTLTQWQHDNPAPSLDEVRRIVEQIGNGLQAMHRREMIHQDIRPENILIDTSGTVKIIDYGSTRVAGIAELGAETELILGTAQFTAPEYFLGQAGSVQSDIFSLGVLIYHLLSGSLPYGSGVSKAYSVAAQRKLNYQSLVQEDRKIPFWVDDSIRKATHIQPNKRYQEVAEFLYDLSHPNKEFVNKARPPLIKREPVLFWKCVSLGLFLVLIFQNFPSA